MVNENKIRIVRISLFSLVMLLYLWFPFQMIQDSRMILREGVQYRFKPQPVDPYDAFRGRYVQLSFQLPSFKQPPDFQQEMRSKTSYVSISVDEQGFAYFDQLYKNIPEGTDYIKTNVQYSDGTNVYIDIPQNMQRYYLNEALAPEAERVYRALLSRNGGSRDSVAVYLDVRILKGAVVMEELYFEGKPVEEYLRDLKLKQ